MTDAAFMLLAAIVLYLGTVAAIVAIIHVYPNLNED